MLQNAGTAGSPAGVGVVTAALQNGIEGTADKVVADAHIQMEDNIGVDIAHGVEEA